MASVDGRDVWVIDLVIDRTNCDYHRNWTGFHARKWLKDPDKYTGFVHDTLAEFLGRAKAESVLEMDSTEKKLALVEALGQKSLEKPVRELFPVRGKETGLQVG